MFLPPANPLRYSADLEKPEPDEAETQAGLIEQILKISQTTLADGGHALRGAHAKSHGIVRAELTVAEDLPPSLSQGLFAKPGRHEAILRFSTSPGDLLDDKVSTPRGLGIKVFGADGPRLPESDGANTQDFVLVNGKAFIAPTAKMFLANLKLLAGTTDKAGELKIALSAALQGIEKLIEAAHGESGTVKALGGHPETHVLGESFYSQVPIRYGDYIAKVGVQPVSPALTALTNAKVDLHDKPDGLRDAVKAFFASQAGAWDVVVQLCTSLEEMPIEQAHKAWSEKASPYVPVARLTAAAQDAWDPGRRPSLDDALSFSPWHGLAAHQPLGSINRVRKAVYEASAKFRLNAVGCPFAEPASAEAIGAA